MHVLVTESSFGRAAGVIGALKRIGCRVSTCHGTTGVCRGLAPGGRCPLDEMWPVDLVVDVRGPEPELTAREMGVVCGLRDRDRVVVVGEPAAPAMAPAGLEGRVTVGTTEELLDACRGALRVGPPAPRRPPPSEQCR